MPTPLPPISAADPPPPPAGGLRLAAYQPDIAPNLGAMIRLSACFGVALDVIEPCGFPLALKTLRRAAMDYAQAARITRWDGWGAFQAARGDGRGDGRGGAMGGAGRLILLSTAAATPLWSHRFAPGDVILMGRESAGVPAEVRDAADARIRIPMPGGGRSLNVAMAAGIALAEAMRQLAARPGRR